MRQPDGLRGLSRRKGSVPRSQPAVRVLITVLGLAGIVEAPVAPVLRVAASSAPTAGTIVTYAGGGVGDGRPATNAILRNAVSTAVNPAGDLYIADAGENRVRVVRNGIMTTLAGTGDAGHSGDGGPARQARLENLKGIAVDHAGNVYVSEAFLADSVVAASGAASAEPNGDIRRIDAHGVISTLASGLGSPWGIALDPSGSHLYVAETGNDDILEVSTADGSITRVAGVPGVDGYTGEAAGVGAMEEAVGNAAGAGGVPASAAILDAPEGVAVDGAGNVYIADTRDESVLKLSGGTITTVLTSMAAGTDLGTWTTADFGKQTLAVAVDSHGRVYVETAGADTGIVEVDHPGSPGTYHTVSPAGVYGFPAFGPGNTFDVADNSCVYEIFIVDKTAHCIAGQVLSIPDQTTELYPRGHDMAVDGQPATNIAFDGVTGIATDAAGQLYVADAARVVRVDTSDVARLAAGRGVSPPPAANVHPEDPNGWSASLATLQPEAVLPDGRGNLFIADGWTGRVLWLDSHGVLHDFGASGVVTAFNNSRYSAGLLFAPDGSLYAADTVANVVRAVRPTGTVVTVAGGGSTGGGSGATTCQIAQSQTAVGLTGLRGDGGPATQACLDLPMGLAKDASGNVYIADSGDNCIRMIDHTTGNLTTVAGNGLAAYAGDGQAATRASLDDPQGVAVDGAGNLFIADTVNRVIREVGTDGVITTVAGTPPDVGYVDRSSVTGQSADRGDGGPASGAILTSPTSVAVDSQGNLYIADGQRVRKVGGIAAKGHAVASTSRALHGRLNRAF